MSWGDWVDHESSNILRSRHDPETNKMQVQFHRAGEHTSTYELSNISAEAHDGFINAESVGSHYAAKFRSNKKHPASKVQ